VVIVEEVLLEQFWWQNWLPVLSIAFVVAQDSPQITEFAVSFTDRFDVGVCECLILPLGLDELLCCKYSLAHELCVLGKTYSVRVSSGLVRWKLSLTQSATVWGLYPLLLVLGLRLIIFNWLGVGNTLCRLLMVYLIPMSLLMRLVM
jgi:hypothetical protein